MKLAQIAEGITYDGHKGGSRKVVKKCNDTNVITYEEGGKRDEMPGQDFAKWAKKVYRDRSNDKPKQEKRAN